VEPAEPVAQREEEEQAVLEVLEVLVELEVQVEQVGQAREQQVNVAVRVAEVLFS
jgi:hypothetical protein